MNISSSDIAFHKKLIIFSAPSGAGKTTLVKKLLAIPELRLEFSISATSRPKRETEADGTDYYFITPEKFKQKIANDEFVEWEEVYAGNCYGTLKSELERIWAKGNNVLFDVDVKGGLSLKKIFGDKALAIFVQPPSLQVLAERLKNRGTESPVSLQKRLDKASYEMTFAKQFDYIVVNDILEGTVQKSRELVESFINYI
ncbi:MAG: guanylate kinase [Lentimicrobiaceae bacterium]|jgi:guanylate kinase|nr:guanylate kinase [Lentimicrobiaceae bacterium]